MWSDIIQSKVRRFDDWTPISGVAAGQAGFREYLGHNDPKSKKKKKVYSFHLLEYRMELWEGTGLFVSTVQSVVLDGE